MNPHFLVGKITRDGKRFLNRFLSLGNTICYADFQNQECLCCNYLPHSVMCVLHRIVESFLAKAILTRSELGSVKCYLHESALLVTIFLAKPVN